MSNSYIPTKTKLLLWVKAGGVCQYRGCTEKMYMDILTKRQYNKAYIAHIIADSPNGPRGHKTKSELLKEEESNLMLLCDSHHRLIDKVDVKGHTVPLLTKMKKEHEKRIARLCSIKEDMHSHIIAYRSNIGKHTPVLDYKTLAPFVTENFYPAADEIIDLSLINSPFKDDNKDFWKIEVENLTQQFSEQIKFKLKQGKIRHISLFAFAPIPLLIKLGTLINDIQNVHVHQPIRDPKTWNLSKKSLPTIYKVKKPTSIKNIVAINISLSATITDNRISKILGNRISLYTITITKPSNDFLKSENQVSIFNETLKQLFDYIKSKHKKSSCIHIFPAMPIALAIELGRTWMPKADLPLKIYDENRAIGGFNHTITIE